MKNLFFSSLLLLATTVTFAQTEKGRGLITGNVSLRTTQLTFPNGRQTVNNITFNVSRGWFVQDNWLIGVGLGAGTGWETFPELLNDGTIVSYNRNVSASGFVRRYFVLNRFRPFLGAGMSGSFNRDRQESRFINAGVVNFDRRFVDRYGFNFLTQLGVLYALTDRIGIDLNAGSNGVPLQFNSFGVGLNILTGGPRNTPDVAVDAPQTQRGGILIGGQLSYDGLTRDERSGQGQPGNVPRNSGGQFSFGPSVAFFIKDNLLIGTNASLSIATNRTDGVLEGSTTFLGITPFVQKFIGQSRLRPFVQADITFNQFWLRNESTGSTGKAQNYGAGVSAGLAYLLGERFIVQATLANLRYERLAGFDQSNAPWQLSASGTTSPTFSVNYVLR